MTYFLYVSEAVLRSIIKVSLAPNVFDDYLNRLFAEAMYVKATQGEGRIKMACFDLYCSLDGDGDLYIDNFTRDFKNDEDWSYQSFQSITGVHPNFPCDYRHLYEHLKRYFYGHSE